MARGHRNSSFVLPPFITGSQHRDTMQRQEEELVQGELIRCAHHRGVSKRGSYSSAAAADSGLNILQGNQQVHFQRQRHFAAIEGRNPTFAAYRFGGWRSTTVAGYGNLPDAAISRGDITTITRHSAATGGLAHRTVHGSIPLNCFRCAYGFLSPAAASCCGHFCGFADGGAFCWRTIIKA